MQTYKKAWTEESKHYMSVDKCLNKMYVCVCLLKVCENVLIMHRIFLWLHACWCLLTSFFGAIIDFNTTYLVGAIGHRSSNLHHSSGWKGAMENTLKHHANMKMWIFTSQKKLESYWLTNFEGFKVPIFMYNLNVLKKLFVLKNYVDHTY